MIEMNFKIKFVSIHLYYFCILNIVTAIVVKPIEI